jgi:hypothetical protein
MLSRSEMKNETVTQATISKFFESYQKREKAFIGTQFLKKL